MRAPASSTSSPATTRIDAVRFVGAVSLPAADLQRVVAPWLRRDLTFADLNALTSAVAAYYRTHGYMVASAYLGKQTIADQTLVVTVVEGKWSRLTLRTNKTRVSDEQILRTLAMNLCRKRGDCKGVGPIVAKKVERAGLMVSEIPGVKSTYVLTAGDEPGSTSLELQATPTKRFTATLGADNTGFAYTGKERGSAGFAVSNLLGRGDLTTLNGTYSGKGFYSFAFDSSLPVGYSGARAGVNASHLHYALGRQFAVLNATGVSDTAGVYATYPAVRNLSSALDVRLDLQGKDTRSEIAAVSSAQNKARTAEAILSLNGSFLDQALKSAASQYRLAFTYGDLNLRDPASRAFDAATARTNGGFGKVTYLARREELLTRGWTIFGQVSGQYTGVNLDSSEKFTLAGPTAVRAYQSGAAASDLATLATLESRVRIPSSITGRWEVIVAPFYDYAWATFNKRTWAGFTGANKGQMAGGGVYVSLSDPGRYSLRLTYAAHQKTAQDVVPNSGDQLWIEAAAAF